MAQNKTWTDNEMLNSLLSITFFFSENILITFDIFFFLLSRKLSFLIHLRMQMRKEEGTLIGLFFLNLGEGGLSGH